MSIGIVKIYCIYFYICYNGGEKESESGGMRYDMDFGLACVSFTW